MKVESPYGSKQNEATSSSAKRLQEKRQVSFSADKLTYRLVRTCSSHASICDAAVLCAPENLQPSVSRVHTLSVVAARLLCSDPLVDLCIPSIPRRLHFLSRGLYLQMSTAELGKILVEDVAGHSTGSLPRVRKRDRLKQAWRSFRDFGGRE